MALACIISKEKQDIGR